MNRWVVAASIALCLVQFGCGEQTSDTKAEKAATPATAPSSQPGAETTSETATPQPAGETAAPQTSDEAAQPQTEAQAKPKKKARPCAEFRKTLCAGIKDRKESDACLVQHKDQLSEECKKALKL